MFIKLSMTAAARMRLNSELKYSALDQQSLSSFSSLIFLGSKNYPHRGTVDRFANRCFANGMHAYTDADGTCYTIATAGDQGFMKILPICVEHILFPSLTESAFLTEVRYGSLLLLFATDALQVYHVDQEGRDGGVMYCEVQSKQNRPAYLMAVGTIVNHPRKR